MNTFTTRPLLAALSALALSLGPVNAQDETDDRHPGSDEIDGLRTSTDFPETTGSGEIDSFVNPSARSYPFPAKGRDLPEGVYWRATGHGNASRKRDMSAARFDPDSGNWTWRYPASSGLSGDERSLIWNVPLYAPMSGLVVGCWNAAVDGTDPLEANCGSNGPGPCQRPGGGNNLRIWNPDEGRMFFLGHLRQGSVPQRLCPHGRTEMADASDKSGPLGMTPELANTLPFPRVEEGDLVGRVGNSGRSSGPHLHIDLLECETPLRDIRDDCRVAPMRFNEADIAVQPSGRDVVEEDWVALDGPIPVTSPFRLVRPDRGIGGLSAPAALSATTEVNARIVVVMEVNNPAEPVNEFDWFISNPVRDEDFDRLLTTEFQVQGNCPTGVKNVEVTTPQGTLTRSFPTSTASFNLTQSFLAFDRTEVSDLCLALATEQSESPLCSQGPDQCLSTINIDFVGGEDGPDSTVGFRMTCHDGTSIEREVVPRLDLQCGLVPFGHIE
ncbi:M23 family metallopeptidase [Vannielia sp. SX4]|uniref:M23 family metallopeptidase n=1 Tax=Vannielia sp. SX4 TaxID=3463852 RepID=UPI0040587BF7